MKKFKLLKFSNLLIAENKNATLSSLKFNVRKPIHSGDGLDAIIRGLMLFLVCFFGFSTAVAQTTPDDCTSGCTSKDIKIIRAYLSDAAGNQLPDTFICSGTAEVYLSLELTTKSPRIGTAIYGNIRSYNPNSVPPSIGGILDTKAQCFGGITLNATNVVTFTTAFTWTCGQAIALADVYISWGTGNTDFCTSDAFQCGATPSKCNKQPGYIVITTPNVGEASSSACSSVALPDYEAYFNLTSLESDIKNGGNLTVSWFSDQGLANAISDADTNTAGLQFHAVAASTNVYAKVCPTGSTACVTVTVPLTVYPKPAAPTICVVQPSASICDNTTTAGSITITAPIGAEGVYDYSIDNGGNWTADKTSWTGLAANSVTGVKVRFTSATNDGCPSDAASCDDSSCASSLAAKTTKPVTNKMTAITPIEASTEKTSFDAYPVPFKDQLTIKYKYDYVSDVKIEVFNARGISVLSKTDRASYLNKEITLDLKGNKEKEQVYIVKLTTDRETTTKKVLSSK